MDRQEYIRNYRQEHREEIKAYKKAYRLEHKEELAKKSKAYKDKHKEEISECGRKYYITHKEERKNYYDEHKKEIAEWGRKYRLEHKEEIMKRLKKYQLEHKEGKARRDKKSYLKHRDERMKMSRNYYQEHKEELSEQFKNYRFEHKRDHKNWLLKKTHDITIDFYDEMLINQGGRCLICGRSQNEFKTAFHVDHNHKTGKVRGLLCGNCNTLLGHCHENINVLQSAIQYLQVYNLGEVPQVTVVLEPREQVHIRIVE